MKASLNIAAFLALLIMPFSSHAQMNGLAPGIYAVTDTVSTPLKYSCGGAYVEIAGVESVIRYEIVHEIFHYAGITSGVNASDTFLFVTDHSRKEIVKTMKEYDVFIRNMSPEDMVLFPLSVNSSKKRREYDASPTMRGFSGEENAAIDFEWKEISDNVYEITVHGLPAGEYAFAFRYSRFYPFDFTAIYGFTIKAD